MKTLTLKNGFVNPKNVLTKFGLIKNINLQGRKKMNTMFEKMKEMCEEFMSKKDFNMKDCCKKMMSMKEHSMKDCCSEKDKTSDVKTNNNSNKEN